MTNEELQEKLNDVKKKLKKAHKENNEEKILYYVIWVSISLATNSI